MRRDVKIGIGVAAALLAALALCVAVIWTFNWNLVRAPLDRQLSELLHRPVSTQGLSVNWFWPQDRSGWRGWLPLPRIRVQGLAVGNPPWSQGDENLLQAGDVSVVVDPWVLLDHVARIDSLQVTAAQASLLRARDGTVNLNRPGASRHPYAS